jgi:malto-oligosyltrehalose trehalohydrolase
VTAFSHAMPFGAALQPDGTTRFRLWAPAQQRVSVVLEDGGAVFPLQKQADGWFELVSDAARAGSRYRFALQDGMRVPDPASRYQPEDVHGPSVVINPRAYGWRNDGWRGRPWHEAVLYELHVGAFTPEGDFDGVRRRLDRLARTGITAIELMPLAEFPGRRNWGYDGVLPFAPDACYGTPE